MRGLSGWIVCFSLCCGTVLCAVETESSNELLFPAEQPPLLPMPQEIAWAGESLPIEAVALTVPESSDFPEQMKFMIRSLTNELKTLSVKTGLTGYPLEFAFSADSELTRNLESYRLSAKESGCRIEAASARGLFYGFQTFKQLLTRRNGQTFLAFCQIKDWPAFQIRGFMNDVGRNFLPLNIIHEEIEMMARYKLNTYHFHLTENFGWRLESKIYPELTAPENNERSPGKFYTQKEFIDLVEFCRLRNITLIPELDLPGHSVAFRKALKVARMDDPRAVEGVCRLIQELASLVPKAKMPYLHIGGDEAHGVEKVTQATLQRYFDMIAACDRRAIAWFPGENVQNFHDPIRQTWTGRRAVPPKGCEYIDSQENYVNHLDPFEAPMTLFFRKNCPFPDRKGLGGILCIWPDLYIPDYRNHLLMTPVYPSMVSYSEAVWKSRIADETLYYSNLPVQGDSKLDEFRAFENRLLAHRDRYFAGKPFPYLRQSNIAWKILGPIPHGGKTARAFAPETEILPEYTIDSKRYTWHSSAYTGATIIFKHYCDYPTLFNPHWKNESPNSTYYAQTHIWSPKDQAVPFWIGAHTWATSDFRDGTVNVPEKWFHADAEFRVNGELIPAPKWKTPNKRDGRAALTPFLEDENYHFRTPTPIHLKKGWNTVLVKSPHNKQTRRWMFTFIPVQWDGKSLGCNVREFPGLRFSATLPDENAH